MNPSDNGEFVTLSGKWNIKRCECNDYENGWMGYYPCKTCLEWKFIQKNITKFPDGTSAYVGDLKEIFSDGSEEITEYSCYCPENELFIDRSYYRPDGYPEVYLNDRYRIEPTGHNEYSLYNLEDVDSGPAGYSSKIIISRICEQ